MKRALLAATMTVLAALTSTATGAGQTAKEVVGLTPDQVRWFTPPYYKDGRQRAQMYGDSTRGGAWVDRVKIPANMRIPAHRHPKDELVTVIDGTWYLGEGDRFDPAKLRSYPAGSFVVIPAGVPHFAASSEGAVIVQLNGMGEFGTEYLEK